MKNYLFVFVSFLLFSCTGDKPCADCNGCGLDLNIKELTMEQAIAKSKSGISSTVDTIDLNESIMKIEEKYGEQWDFCDCVVKGDSINKAFSESNLPDAEFERLSKRFDVIDQKCQAFRIQDANRTPEQREMHEKKVKKCLREAGVRIK
jgi:hypothetical protein